MIQKRKFVLSVVAAIYLAVVNIPSVAQNQGGRGGAAADPIKKATQIKPDLWYIADGGANSVVEVTPEGLDLKFGGTEVEAHYFGSAHTDADTIVFFKTKKFVMLSDLVNYANPSPGISGNNAVQVPGILDRVLKLDFDRAIAGRGPLLTKADVQAYKKTWDTLMARVKDAVKAGASRESLASQVEQDDLFSPGLKAPWAFNSNFFSQLFDALKSNPNGEPRQAE